MTFEDINLVDQPAGFMDSKDMKPIKKELQDANRSLDLIRELIANSRNNVFRFADGKFFKKLIF